MIKVRFAPSPTGFLHVGGLRTFLYNWLFTKQNKGKIFLRIEDTDRERLIEGAIENLIKALKDIGLNWDGKPYIQSEHLLTYQNLAQQLVERGCAYYCFCSKETLEKMRQEQAEKKMPPAYDKRCRKLTKKEIENLLQKQTPYVIRLSVPEEGRVKFNDLLHGEIEFNLKDIDDQILLKSDGWPTYHLANVVDDHLMGITHVIRGEEWLPSTPKHVLIYQAFGWKIPQFAHLPLLLRPDRSKLSKRESDVAVEEYLASGYLPEAIINFVALLGWHPKDDQEIFTLKELIKKFNLKDVQKSGAIFEKEKLDWLNGFWIRKMSIFKLAKKCLPYLINSRLVKKPIDRKKIKKIVALEQERLKKLSDITNLADFFFLKELNYPLELLKWRKMELSQVKENLIKAKELLSSIPEKKFKAKNINNSLMELAQKTGTGELFWPFRVALTGKQASPPPQDVAEILKKEGALKRLEIAIKRL